MSRYRDDELITWPQAKAAAVRLRELLAERGWTQRRLSQVSGVPYGTINHAVTGRVRMLTVSAEKLAAALGTDLAGLTRAPARLPEPETAP